MSEISQSYVEMCKAPHIRTMLARVAVEDARLNLYIGDATEPVLVSDDEDAFEDAIKALQVKLGKPTLFILNEMTGMVVTYMGTPIKGLGMDKYGKMYVSK